MAQLSSGRLIRPNGSLSRWNGGLDALLAAKDYEDPDIHSDDLLIGKSLRSNRPIPCRTPSHSAAFRRGAAFGATSPKPNCEMAVVSATYMSTSIPAPGHHIRPSDIAPALLPVQASRLSPVLLGDYVRTVRSTIARRSAVPST